LIDTLHLDLTSYSKTFNSLSPQGQWFCSRIGKRDYPLYECDFNIIKKFITKNNPKKVFCNSFFGDSTEYKDIIKLSKLCKKLEIELMIFTNGSNLDKNLIQQLLDNDASFYLFCFGIQDNIDKVIHNITWDSISSFLKQTKNKTIIEFIAYKHNVNDISKLLQICNDNRNNIKITKGNTFEYDVVNIFDEFGYWLYDVLRVTEDLPFEDEFLYDVTEAIEVYNKLDLNQTDLYRSTLGYMNTRYFIKNDVGLDIFDLNIPDLSEDFKLNLEYNNEVFINSTGHLFCNRESYEVFNNCLCNDWSIRAERYVYQNFNHVMTTLNKLHQADTEFMNSTLLKNLFYYNKNHEECTVENNLEDFYWN